MPHKMSISTQEQLTRAVSNSLIMAKLRAALLAATSVHRLELMPAVLGLRITETIQSFDYQLR